MDKKMLNEYIKRIIREEIKQSKADDSLIRENIDKELYLNAYYNRINKEYNNLLVKVRNNPNFVFVLGVDVELNQCGAANKCETNSYDFIKSSLERGEDNFFPVGGYMFTAKSLYPVEHWWVYDSVRNKNIEVTPLLGEKPWCYAGVINYDINEAILKSNKVWDVDFFKGGNSYYNYFK